MKTFLYYIGKPRDPHANAMAADFAARAARYCACEMREIRPDRTDPWLKHPSARRILLDPAGKSLDTPGFVALVSQSEMDGRDLVFVMGGADGLPAAWRGRADLLLALSPMTSRTSWRAPCSPSRSIAPSPPCGAIPTRANVITSTCPGSRHKTRRREK